ncbi:MAG: cytochrome b/b6 domain-containing protein [Rhodospirillales bacterium]|nr:cytochrome b/b6 domain-containing protein [Rhodospirillales bacterium]
MSSRHPPMTRALHAGIAVGMSAQMLTSLAMVYPKPGRLPNAWYEVHETLGMALLGLLLVHWLWVLLRTLRGEPLMLMPWFSPQRRAALWADLREVVADLSRLRLPADDRPRPLAAAIQGLGLLLGVALAGTGTALALGMAENGAMGPLLHDVKEVHEALGPLMWAYLAVHPTLALLHQMAGHGTLSAMFRLR